MRLVWQNIECKLINCSLDTTDLKSAGDAHPHRCFSFVDSGLCRGGGGRIKVLLYKISFLVDINETSLSQLLQVDEDETLSRETTSVVMTSRRTCPGWGSGSGQHVRLPAHRWTSAWKWCQLPADCSQAYRDHMTPPQWGRGATTDLKLSTLTGCDGLYVS